MANLETAVRTQESVLATNKVIRNTYTLLSMTLLFITTAAPAHSALNNSVMESRV